MKKSISFVLLLVVSTLSAQTGTIKGIVLDKQSESPLEGATIELLTPSNAIGAVTDRNGRFVLREVPVGRQVVRVSYIGFESSTIPNIEVTSGKDVFLNTSLVEAFDQLDEVVLTSDTNKDIPLNKLATVSARQFGLEEVTRFSGGRSDVGRLAANFAGVSAPDDSRNDIVVRGNSPTRTFMAVGRHSHSKSQPLWDCRNHWRACFCSKSQYVEEFRFSYLCLSRRIRKCDWRGL